MMNSFIELRRGWSYRRGRVGESSSISSSRIGDGNVCVCGVDVSDLKIKTIFHQSTRSP
jgi:hypothetical protein